MINIFLSHLYYFVSLQGIEEMTTWHRTSGLNFLLTAVTIPANCTVSVRIPKYHFSVFFFFF